MTYFQKIIACVVISIFCSTISGCAGGKDVPYNQVFTGFNGPTLPGTFSYLTEQDVDKSWVKRALTPEDYTKVTKAMRDGNKALVAVAAGNSERANGQINIIRVYFYDGNLKGTLGDSAISSTVTVGVIGPECKGDFKSSYPFALALITKPSKLFPPVAGSYDVSEFANGCAPVRTGTPND